MSPADDLPSSLGRYRILEEIGRGTMGVVYRAHDPVLGRTVALKTIAATWARAAGDPDGFERRFLAEARAAAALSHPSIVVVHDAGRDEATGSLFMALEHLEGTPLSDRLREGPLPWTEAAAIAARLAEALDHAHRNGVVHRDVKPANVMLRPGSAPKLMDFGVARIEAANLTAAGEFFGTPNYMAPEQARGERVDGRSDIFALGALLYAMLSGKPPFAGGPVPAILSRVLHDAPLPLDVPGLPPALAAIVERCLAKDPGARYARAGLLAEDLDDVRAGRAPRHLPRAAPPAARLGWHRGRIDRRAVAVAAVVFAATVAAGLHLRGRAPDGETTPGAVPPSTTLGATPSRLEFTVTHPFRSATLRVWVDDRLVVEEKLSARVTRDLLALRLRRGTQRGEAQVPSGEHEVRVSVEEPDGFRASRRLRGRFEPGRARRLEVAIEGVLRKQMTVTWAG